MYLIHLNISYIYIFIHFIHNPHPNDNVIVLMGMDKVVLYYIVFKVPVKHASCLA